MHEEQSGRGEFGRLLAGILERTGLTLQQAADVAGVNRSQVWRWVNSGSVPKYEPVRRLAAYLMAERPEVADRAAALLPAAGYETPPASESHLLTLPRITEPGRAAPPAPPGFVTDEIKEEARPFADEIWERLWMLAGNRAPDPTGDGQPPDPGGAALFGEGTHDQFAWDSAAPYRPLAKTWFLAVLRSRREAAGDQEQGTGAGLARAHP